VGDNQGGDTMITMKLTFRYNQVALKYFCETMRRYTEDPKYAKELKLFKEGKLTLNQEMENGKPVLIIKVDADVEYEEQEMKNWEESKKKWKSITNRTKMMIAGINQEVTYKRKTLSSS
jgi:hypothetical protein